ncbi:hypothetical protein [Streptomyces luteireticuli]|uniref:hypothetical protein n=1 Tax=Streptomyces luteireticuli TaxID=173858 RepID=UPI003555DBA3
MRVDGTLHHRLAFALGVSPGRVNRALHHHPQAVERRELLAELLAGLFERARIVHVPAVVERDEPGSLAVAVLVQRAPTVAARLGNHELDRFRRLLHDRALAGVDAAYAQSERVARRAGERHDKFTQLIDAAPVHSARVLSGFLAQAVNARQWRIVVALADAGPDGLIDHAEAGPEAWEALRAREFAVKAVRGDQDVHLLSPRGRDALRAEYGLYACLYPRTRTPQVLGGRFTRRSSVTVG